MASSPYHIFLTGASSGIGNAIANNLLSNNFSLTLLGRNESKMQSIFPSSSQLSFLHWNPLDSHFVDFKSIKISDSVQNLGLISCAGVEHSLPLLRTPDYLFEEMLSVNAVANYYLSKQFIRTQIAKKLPISLIFLSSIVGIDGNAGQVGYSASKSFLQGLSNSLAKEFGPLVRSNTINPGFVDTPMTKKFFKKNDHINIQDLKDQLPLKDFTQIDDIVSTVNYILKTSGVTGQTFKYQ